MSRGVYFIEDPGRGIKIGYSKDARKRAYALQTGSPHKLNILGVVDVHRDFETHLHGHLRAHRLNREWFADVHEVRACLSRILMDGPSAVGFSEPGLSAREKIEQMNRHYTLLRLREMLGWPGKVGEGRIKRVLYGDQRPNERETADINRAFATYAREKIAANNAENLRLSAYLDSREA